MKLKIRKISLSSNISILTLLAFIVNLIIILVSFNIKNLPVNNWMIRFVIIILIQLFINVFLIIKSGEDFFSLSILFLLFTFIFNFGQTLLIAFNIDGRIAFNVKELFSDNIYKDSCQYALYIQSFVAIGILIARIRKDKKLFPQNYNKKQASLKLIKKISLVLICIGIIPKLYIDLSRIVLYSKGNYYSTYNLNIPGIIYTISHTAEIGIIGLMISKHDNKRFSNVLLLIILVYEGIIMMSGNRGRSMVFLIAIFYIYFNLIKKLSIKTFLMIFLMGYFGLVFINIISDIRLYGIDTINFLKQNILIYAFQKNPIFDMLGEFGSTLLSLCVPVEYNDIVSPKLGSSYILSLLTIFPNIGGILNDVVNNITFVNFYRTFKDFPYGGSYIGELFVNFRYMGIAIAIIIGYFIGNISKKIKYYLIEEDYVKLCIYMILFPNILWWVRDYFSSLIRDFIWISILILTCKLIFNTKNKFKDL